MGIAIVFIASTICFVLAFKSIGLFIRFMIYHFQTGSNVTTAIIVIIAGSIWIIFGL